MPTIFQPPLDPSDATIQQAPSWLPRLHPGYFYLNDRQYYLYSQKKTITLRDATKYIFELAAVPEPGTVEVLVEGVPFSSFELQGNELHLMATDQESYAALFEATELDITQFGFLLHGFAFGPSNQVVVNYTTLLWEGSGAASEPTGNVYTSSTVSETFRIKEASRIEYQITKPRQIIKPTGETLLLTLPEHSGFLPDPPVAGAPVVITDDNYQLTDERGFQTEYFVDPLTAEIVFNTKRNYVQNPAFEVTATGGGYPVPAYNYPLEWWVTDTLTVTEGTGDPFYGTSYRCLDGTGELIQTIDTFDPRTPWTFSVYSQGDGTGHLYVTFLDSEGFYLDATGMITSTGAPNFNVYENSVELPPRSSWTRSALTFGTTDPTQCEATGIFVEIPSGAASAEIKLGRDFGEVCVDAVSANHGYTAAEFEPVDPNMTLEYESSLRGYWAAEPSGQLPFEIDVLELNALRTAIPGGFLAIEEFSSVEDYQLGLGNFVEGNSISHTGILQITGALGVNVGRKYRPYAKTSGFDKLVPRNKFHLQNPAPLDDISDLTIEHGTPDPIPDSIEWTPTDGLRAAGDDAQLAVIPDERIVKRLDAVVLDAYKNPAYTYRATIVAATGEVDTIYTTDFITNHLGQLYFNYRPPTISTTGSIGQIDTITLSVGSISEQLPVFGYTPGSLDLDGFLG